MAQYRQSGGGFFDSRGGAHHSLPEYHRAHPSKPSRIRRPGKPARRRSPAAAAVAAALLLAGVFLLSRRLSRHSAEITQDLGGGEGLPEWNRSKNWKELKFGHGGGGRSAQDSRYWDRDDRRRDEDYSEDEKEKISGAGGNAGDAGSSSEKGVTSDPGVDKGLALEITGGGEEGAEMAEGGKGGTLYNEGGRKELEQYEAAAMGAAGTGMREVDPDDEYDDGIDAQDGFDDAQLHSSDGGRKLGDGSHVTVEKKENVALERHTEAGGWISDGSDAGNVDQRKVSGTGDKNHGSKKKSKRKKSGSTCEMRFLNSTAQLVEPAKNEKFSSFNLQYVEAEERPIGSEYWEPRFAGHQSLQEREESYLAHDQQLKCAFVKGPNGTRTGFDISEDVQKYMSKCHIAVSSCIFGNSDRLRTPFGKTITSLSKKTVCFAMFLDEVTLQTLESEGQKMNSMGFIGIWKIILIKNMPYNDMRRVGKIPKFLAHRLFPSSRFSIWLDSKLRLQSDPILILEYFLWQHGYEYAISNHYDRHCVWEEVAQNKKLNKFNHTIIDQQFEFYQADGLSRFNPSDPNKLLPSCMLPYLLVSLLFNKFELVVGAFFFLPSQPSDLNTEILTIHLTSLSLSLISNYPSSLLPPMVTISHHLFYPASLASLPSCSACFRFPSLRPLPFLPRRCLLLLGLRRGFPLVPHLRRAVRRQPRRRPRGAPRTALPPLYLLPPCPLPLLSPAGSLPEPARRRQPPRHGRGASLPSALSLLDHLSHCGVPARVSNFVRNFVKWTKFCPFRCLEKYVSLGEILAEFGPT